jgi:adenine-specific DNA-methyltransferase
MKKQQTTNSIKIQSKNLEILKKHFPHCFDKNGNFYLEKFKQELSKNEDIDFSNESYGMDWLGKSYARLLASDEATTLLKENKEWNKKTENKNSENLLIKGDNLEVLKHLSNAYYEKIKMIYIDQPYNTGSDGFVYQDDRKFTVEELSRLAGIDEEKAKRILEFTQSKSNSHSAWLTFMYPRLYIAKHLLREDGVIFVSIDDNEVAQLRLLMNEIFGDENFVAELPTIMNLKGNNDEFGFAGTHEYTIVYSKNKIKTVLNQFNLSDDDLEDWNEDEIGFYKQGASLKATGNNAPREKRPNLYYPIFIDSKDTVYVTEDDNPPKEYQGKLITLYPITNGQEMSWRWSRDKVKNERNNIIVSRNGKIGIFKKQRPSLGDLPSKKPKTIFYKPEYSSGNGTAQIKSLFGVKCFDNPKPTELIKDFIIIGTMEKDIVLDLFAGSGTTGDAVMQINAEDGGNRRFILVQLPEIIDLKKNKTTYDFVKNELKVDEPTIFEITKERLIRAAKKINEETINKKIKEKESEIKKLQEQLDLKGKKEKIENLKQEIEKLKNQDFGFKIFETIPNDKGNWVNYILDAEKFDPQTELFDESKLTKEDLETLLTTWKTYDGFSLTQNLKEIDLDGYIGYYLDNKLYLVDKGFETNHLRKMLEVIDSKKGFKPAVIIAFGYNFESKILREIADNVKNYANKKQIEIDFIARY